MVQTQEQIRAFCDSQEGTLDEAVQHTNALTQLYTSGEPIEPTLFYAMGQKLQGAIEANPPQDKETAVVYTESVVALYELGSQAGDVNASVAAGMMFTVGVKKGDVELLVPNPKRAMEDFKNIAEHPEGEKVLAEVKKRLGEEHGKLVDEVVKRVGKEASSQQER